ncbi:hypothetical protein BSK63_17345 [Paenibacillus odorifer]|uniref:hypothetical protein n=1 Tax=Paenibacillus TaxID=44249 RepID=UPI00096FAFB8|nr:hypothetical protein [Paenibacillus odorifer]OME30658.1 hypothetical protein BSK63_17345 [Paenibacillus odorifer]
MKLQHKIYAGMVFVVLVGGTSLFISRNNNEADSLSPNYLINDQGQTYGHGPYPSGISQEPELIRAVGENGTIGYVKATDLDSEVTSPEEAIVYEETTKDLEYKSIPLYKDDGKTVIGKYKMYFSHGD